MFLLSGIGRAFVARDSASAAVEWIENRFTGPSPLSDCGPWRAAWAFRLRCSNAASSVRWASPGHRVAPGDAFRWRRKIYWGDKADAFITTANKVSTKP